MPRRGSDWDRVLRAAQCFGLQLWWFGSGISQFCSGTESASITALGSTQILLEVRHCNNLNPFAVYVLTENADRTSASGGTCSNVSGTLRAELVTPACQPDSR